MKKVLIFVLALMLAIVPLSAAMSPWAIEEILEAKNLKLVPENLDSDFQNEITRAEFCQLAVELSKSVLLKRNASIVELAQVKNIDLSNNPFTDTRDKNVIFAYHAGIVSGRDATTFDPHSKITRQEAAKMLGNTSKFFDVFELVTFKDVSYSDDYNIASWALDDVRFLNKAGVMKGINPEKFAPKDLYTREQAMVTFLRLRNHIKKEYTEAGKWSE